MRIPALGRPACVAVPECGSLAQVPAKRERTPKTRAAGFTTTIIVDDNGHVLPGHNKRMTSFQPSGEVAGLKRWPESSTHPSPPVAGMGYKGISTSYLPSSTVYLRVNPDDREYFNFF